MIVLLQQCTKLGILYQHVALYFTSQNVALCVRNSLNWLNLRGDGIFPPEYYFLFSPVR